MMNHSLIALVLLMLSACSTSDTLTTEDQQTADLQTETRNEEELSVYIEELHYRFLIQEFGEENEYVAYYRERFDEIARKGPRGCPPPQPCDVIANCFDSLNLHGLEQLKSYNVEEAQINVYSMNGNEINAIAGIEASRCPRPSNLDFIFEEPFYDNGIIEIEFYSNEFEESFQIKLEFVAE